jgi:DNA repair protein RecN (Recombination protein N)
MLASLTIKNFALIESLELSFEGGFAVITGETGAGKTIIIDALGMLLGERASSDVIRAGAEKAIVEGTFVGAGPKRVTAILKENELDTQDTLLIRREISTKGSSRCFINDTPAPLAVLKEIGDMLVDLHGQHEHQSLLRPETHIDFLDAFTGVESEKDLFAASYHKLGKFFSDITSLRNREQSLREKKSILDFQLKEIDAVSPQPEEDTQIQNELKRAENVEQLFALTAELQSLLYDGELSIHDQLSQALQRLTSLETIDAAFSKLREECTAAASSIDDVSKFLRRYNEQLEFDPATLEEKRTRLFAISGLKRKYGGSLEAVLARREEIFSELQTAENFDAEIAKMQTEAEREREKCSALAKTLGNARRRAAKQIESKIADSLKNLGITSPKFSVSISTLETRDDQPYVVLDGKAYAATAKGIDRVEFFLSTNAGEDVKPLAKVASGGEVSRVMLALKSALAASDRTPVLIFDEIDTGISGRVAQKVGAAMRELAEHHQVIAITHLPQIAGCARSHFAVEKIQSNGKTTTTVKKLTEKERLHEIAKLISGENVTDASLKSAKELLIS